MAQPEADMMGAQGGGGGRPIANPRHPGGNGPGPSHDAGPGSRAFGHGKVILLGEHAVVYGQPALGAGLSLGIWAEASAGTGALEAPSWDLRARAGDDSDVGRAFAAIATRLGTRQVHVDVRLGGDLPTRSGLGSSAATAIAIARAIAAFGGISDAALILQAAADAEVVFHGNPSGVDLAAASSGQVGRFEKNVGWLAIDMLQPITLCVGLSGVRRDTRAQVDAVRRLRARTPQVDAVIATAGAVAIAGESALARGDIDELGRLFDVAHGLLAALRVSSPELDALVHLARAAGAVGAKLTGAGGGGAVIALAPGHEKDVLTRWGAAGFAGFVTQIGSCQQETVIDRAGRAGASSPPPAAPAPGERREEAR